MVETIRLGNIAIAVERKGVKNVHLSVHPPHGRVTLVVPNGARIEVVRAYAATRLGWIRKQQASLRGQAREPRRRYVERESHYLWGRRHLLSVVHRDARPSVSVGHRRITLAVRPESTHETRDRVMQEWHRSLLHDALPPLIAKWQRRLDVEVSAYFLQRMKTKWGSCNPLKRTIRINTELIKKPKDLLEYVVVHEMLHLMESTHSDRFTTLLSQHYPTWREARKELNELPVPSISRN
jgi:predicted metal-dependent hydrolase